MLALALAADASKNVTAATSPALDDNSKALATTESILNQWTATGKQSLTQNGFQRLPGGLILQWGVASFTTTGNPVSFPMAFPSACYIVVTGLLSSPGGSTFAGSPGLTGFSARLTAGTTSSHCWFAVGK